MKDAGMIGPVAGDARKDSAIGFDLPSRSVPHSRLSQPSTTPALSNSISASSQVPLTLHPTNTSSDPQPREGNPNILPIPRKPDHQFDPRQLRDLDVIQRGGNGCARRGEEWNQETSDFEHGGAGAMATTVWGTSSSGLRQFVATAPEGRPYEDVLPFRVDTTDANGPIAGNSGWDASNSATAWDAAQQAQEWNQVVDDSWLEGPVWTSDMATRDIYASYEGGDVKW